MNIESKLGKIVEAFDQKVGPDYLVLRLFFLQLRTRSSKENCTVTRLNAARISLAQPTVRATPIGVFRLNGCVF